MSILERLDENHGRVFSVSKLADNTFAVREECDAYYSEVLSADELRQLGRELIALADGEKP